MPYLIDSDRVIPYLHGDPDAVQLLEQLAPQGIGISIITYMEVYDGLAREPNPRRAEADLQAFLTSVPIFPFTLAVARRCAELRQSLRAQGRRVGSRALDLIVAATALEHGLILVTRNVADYRDVPGLQLR